MLETLKKKLAGEGTGIVVTDTPEFKALQEEFNTLQAAYASIEADFTAAQALLDETSAKLAEVTAELSEARAIVGEQLAAKEAAEAAALAAKAEARKQLVVEAIGEERAVAFLKATEGMDDATFEVVSSALKGTVATEASSVLFKEVGVEGKTNASALPKEETAEMKMLREKYETGASK